MSRPDVISCDTCGKSVRVAIGGRVPRFCGDTCRKVSYGGECIDCGARTGAVVKGKPYERCKACACAVGRPTTVGAKRRADILRFINAHIGDYGYPPTVREIGAAVGLDSTSTTHAHLAILVNGGLLNAPPTVGASRTVVLTGKARDLLAADERLVAA